MNNMANSMPATLVEASIQDLSLALETGRITAVELAAKYLLRISTYDCRNTSLNSIPLLNPNVFAEAEASDDRRQNGQAIGQLDGIPFTVKDSYKVKGMTVASGSEAFRDLVANEDAFTVEALRNAGAVLLGKTNMCPMAFGGMIRGVYGRAESPYNSKFLAAAFASGSSNGSGVSTAASFAAFGMGEETVSSGRSPASNNGLVAYTPSRGLISIRGNWPLYPTCDTVVPHTRTMDDLFDILDVLATEDSRTAGDFWRDQPFVEIPKSWHDRPNSFRSIRQIDFLKGKRIGIPQMYLGGTTNKSTVYTSDAVRSLWQAAKTDLEDYGAIVETCSDFPAVTAYEDPSKWPEDRDQTARLPNNWNNTERGTLIAHGWDDFLRMNGDPNIPSLASADYTKMFPQLPAGNPQVRFSEFANAVHWSELASYVEDNDVLTGSCRRKMYNIPDLEQAVKALERMRRVLFEDWMAKNQFDFVVFPAAGDVGFAEADVDMKLAKHTWRNGVKYSNGNRALRHLGIPSVTVTMGMIPGKNMPMGLTILGRAYDDIAILKAGYAFEQLCKRRMAPPLTSPLQSDRWPDEKLEQAASRPQLHVTTCAAVGSRGDKMKLSIEGNFKVAEDTQQSCLPILDIYIDAVKVSEGHIQLRDTSSEGSQELFEFKCSVSSPTPPRLDERNQVVSRIARDSVMVVVLARSRPEGRPSGCLRLIHMDDIVLN